MRNLRRAGVGAGIGVLTMALAAPSAVAAPKAEGHATLTGFAVLPAATFVSASDPSGSLLGGTPSNGITPPFADQPIQGFSGIVRNGDGTFDWIGDEFGPYLLHFDRAGRLLQAPVPLDGVRAPENPAGNPTVNSSKGFEGLAQSPDGRKLYALLEGVVAGDAAGALRLNEFDVASRSYTGRRWTYQLEDPANAIGDAIAVDDDRFLVIERDNGQGATAKFKRIYLADKRDRDRDGRLDKTLVADLMNLADPHHLGGSAGTFTFPFQTIEDVVILDDRTLGVVNDNNFPFSSGRTPGKADDNEFITIRLAAPLHADKRLLK